MTSREFITREFNKPGKAKDLASIHKDAAGNIYSYGSHYPLLFKIAGLTFINTRGYSSTTAKHIAWAWSAADYNAIGVELDRADRLPLTLAIIELRLVEMSDHLTKTMGDTKRKDTGRYGRMVLDLEIIGTSLDRVRAQNDDPAANIIEPAGRPSIDHLSSVAAVMALGDLFSDDQAGANDWKTRMLKAGVPDGLYMPDDWDQLTEDEKTKRLNGVIAALGEDTK